MITSDLIAVQKTLVVARDVEAEVGRGGSG